MMAEGEDPRPAEAESSDRADRADRREGQDRREGRGRLSSIDMLPDEAEPDIAWANDALRERKLPATVIFTEFNERLADKGMGPVSRSAWNRYSVRQAIQFRKHDEARKMSAELVAKLGSEGADEVTVMIAEMIKLAMFEQLEDGKLSSKGVMELARGLSSVVAAQKGSLDYRQKLKDDLDRRMKEAAAAITEVGTKAGVSAETLAEINRQLGVA